MAFGVEEFAAQLRALGLASTVRDQRVVVPYAIKDGRLKGTEIRLGFEVPPDFPRKPPGGFHIAPALLPVNPGAPSHPERVAASNFGGEFGGEWIYLSRPLHGWRGTEGITKVLAHVGLMLESS